MSAAPLPTPAPPDAITLRIVVDGAAAAGKASTARALSRCLDRPVTPADGDDARTLWFDWHAGADGAGDGRPVVAQVVTVPAHSAGRRRRLVASADAVLFVADASTAGLPGSVRALAELRAMVADGPFPRPRILVQANKRDLPGPSLSVLRRRLGIAPGDELVETRALEGDGVQQAFASAVGLALRHHEAGPAEEVVAVAAEGRAADAQASFDRAWAEAAGAPATLEEALTLVPEPQVAAIRAGASVDVPLELIASLRSAAPDEPTAGDLPRRDLAVSRFRASPTAAPETTDVLTSGDVTTDVRVPAPSPPDDAPPGERASARAWEWRRLLRSPRPEDQQ